MPLHEELRELAMGEDAVVAPDRGKAREPGEPREHIRGIERAPERTLDLPAQRADLMTLAPRFHGWRVGCSERPSHAQRIVMDPTIWVARASGSGISLLSSI